MKKTLTILFLLIAIVSQGQSPINKFIKPNNSFGMHFNRVLNDSFTNVPVLDTIQAPLIVGEKRFRLADSTEYIAIDTTTGHQRWLAGVAGSRDGNNYPVSLSFSNNRLTITRNGLGSITADWDSTLYHSFPYYNTQYAQKTHGHVASDISDFTTAVRNLFSNGTGITYNPATGVIAWDGSGAGITSFNGLTGGTQTLAIDTAYAGASSWSSVGTAHTLRLNKRLFDTNFVHSSAYNDIRYAPIGIGIQQVLNNGSTLTGDNGINGFGHFAFSNFSQVQIFTPLDVEKTSGGVTTNLIIDNGYAYLTATKSGVSRGFRAWGDSVKITGLDRNSSPILKNVKIDSATGKIYYYDDVGGVTQAQLDDSTAAIRAAIGYTSITNVGNKDTLAVKVNDSTIGIKSITIVNGTNTTVSKTITDTTIQYQINASGGGGTTTNALTINNSGSGDASGSTFNGSAAKTISYNSIGAEASFTETTQEFTGSTTMSITLSNTPKSGKAEMYYLNGIVIKSSNISRTGTSVTLSGFTRESSDVITAKYSY